VSESVTEVPSGTPQIFRLMSAVMGDIGAVAKNSECNAGAGGRFKFRGIDAAMNAVNPALVKNGVFFLPFLERIDYAERMTNSEPPKRQTVVTVQVQYTFYAPDGSHLTTMFPGEGVDIGDKATNKAMTAALKYMLFETFCIATEDTEDADKTQPEESKPTGRLVQQMGSQRPPGSIVASNPENMSKNQRDMIALKTLALSHGWQPEMVRDWLADRKAKGVPHDKMILEGNLFFNRQAPDELSAILEEGNEVPF